MVTSYAVHEADKAIGRARVALAHAHRLTDLSKTTEYQRAIGEARHHIIKAVSYLEDAQPIVQACADLPPQLDAAEKSVARLRDHLVTLQNRRVNNDGETVDTAE